ncbi:MAG: DNA polymerase I [Alphaproteobacteria bacterium]|nr:DNA polymerase I [Alphaproteobacteria bacterium]MDE2109708.1 DNA polymerase I [Alphaproteobacteria bacterium]MDE2494949.1 DNA polymerase I [Alphaproteobacteria bacterium]
MPLLRPPFCPEGGGRGALSAPLKKGDHLYLIDGSGYLFRAYHALPPLSRKSDGLPTGAVSGYCNMLWKLLEDMKDGDRPTHLAVIFDAGKKTFRNDIYPDYKANRPEPPEDLIPQFPLVRDATRAFGVACVEEKGFEADDLIATYARLAREAGARVTIVSSDKDLMQLVVDGKVELLDTMKNKKIGSAEVMERFGVPPSKVVEVQALAGDSTDNVPGVPGIGVKTAAELINTYGDLETLLGRAGEIKQPKRRETLLANVDKARMSQKLVQLDDHAPLTQTPDVFGVREPDHAQLLGFLKAMEFATLTKRAAAHYGMESTDAIPGAPVETKKSAGKVEQAKSATDAAQRSHGGTVGVVANRAVILKPIDHAAYETVTTLQRLDKWIARSSEIGTVCVDTETTSLDAMQAALCGVSLAVAPNEACYLPCGHVAGEGLSFDAGKEIKQLKEADLLERLKPLLEDESILKVGQNLKYDYLIFRRRGIRLAPFDDTMLMSYVLDAGLQGHGMDELSEKYLGHTPISFGDVAGKGKEKITFDRVSIPEATRYSAEDADVTLRLWLLLKPRLAEERKRTVYETLERPLAPVLAEMEREGIAVDPDLLRNLSNDFATEQAKLESGIHKLAGESFNVGSPKQLGDILFGKFSLPGGKKTKTGAWSTDADVLEELAAQGHDLPKKVLDWRTLAKLRGTYTDALPTYINPQTGRVHTSFAMAAAATGRLASTDPNLQNIPIRTAEGRRIRQAFIAPKGSKLISADYSQIELRILAHMADIPALKKAFADGLDIHAMTASEIFGVPVKGMPAEVRRRAKAINFGIVYGISGFGLANQLGIARSEADDYIKKYFQRFPGIRDYMESTKAFAREHGYVETLFGRRVHIREIRSANPGHRGGAERAAINAPIQGTAADIIRRAMIRIPEALAKAKLDAKMLLQVHDELVFEATDGEVEKTCSTAVSVMEQASLPAIPLSVRLTVEARAAQNWDDAH